MELPVLERAAWGREGPAWMQSPTMVKLGGPEGLRKLRETKRCTEIAVIAGVTRERIRQLCNRFGIPPDGKNIQAQVDAEKERQYFEQAPGPLPRVAAVFRAAGCVLRTVDDGDRDLGRLTTSTPRRMLVEFPDQVVGEAVIPGVRAHVRIAYCGKPGRTAPSGPLYYRLATTWYWRVNDPDRYVLWCRRDGFLVPMAAYPKSQTKTRYVPANLVRVIPYPFRFLRLEEYTPAQLRDWVATGAIWRAGADEPSGRWRFVPPAMDDVTKGD